MNIMPSMHQAGKERQEKAVKKRRADDDEAGLRVRASEGSWRQFSCYNTSVIREEGIFRQGMKKETTTTMLANDNQTA